MLSRALALGGLLAAVTVSAVLVLGSGTSYTVHALFTDASQLVKGDQVEVAGTPVGSVSSLALSSDGRAEVTLTIDAHDLIPLHRGVQATVRVQSLSGIANRYIELLLPSAGTPEIPNGGTLPATDTHSAVDLDEVLDSLDSPTRAALASFVRGSGAQYMGQSKAANLGWLYLDPAVSTTDQLLAELDRDTPMLERFVVASAQEAADITAQPDRLGGLVDNLSSAMHAIAVRQSQLADALHTLPPFMRQANTTFVNLRATLDRLTPLVNASKPLAPKLSPYFGALRTLAHNARPTLADLAAIIRRSGPNNDLIDVFNSSIPVRNIAVGPVRADGARRPGAFPASAQSINASIPELAFARPYTVDLTGWFSDFGHSGVQDALGGAARVLSDFNAFAVQGGTFEPIPPSLRQQVFQAIAGIGMNNRCPGSDERSFPGSPLPWKPYPGYPCDPADRAMGK